MVFLPKLSHNKMSENFGGPLAKERHPKSKNIKLSRFGRNLACTALTMIVFAAVRVQAQESKWALPLSASLGIGSMKDSELNLKSRAMNSLSLEALPSYRFGKWMLGPHLDYRWQGQVSSLDSAGGTNLKGHGYLLGLGARSDFSDRFFAQASVDLFGQYVFYKQTVAGEDDQLKSPLGIRIKSGYAFIEKIPNLTFDIDLQYLTFKKIQISQVDSGASTVQLMASVGMTYQFGKGTSRPSSESTTTNEEVKSIQDSLALKLSGNSFDFRSSDLKPEAKAQLEKVAETMAKNPSVNIRVEGHTDSVGSEKRNERLSRLRALSVKAFLVEHGVDASRVSTKGFGSSKPIADNKTEEGRAKNRRVEIYVDTRKSGQK
jgi:outer membrane protein OmpA-like peptidoglycan-associated protein